MIVAEMIAELQKLDQNAEVVYFDSDFSVNWIPAIIEEPKLQLRQIPGKKQYVGDHEMFVEPEWTHVSAVEIGPDLEHRR